MPPRNAALVSRNALKLGLFGANCSGGRTYASIPEAWVASWENNLRLAQLGDDLGFECIVPIARWKGYPGAARMNATSFESITWACGILASTRRINVFCTVHVSLFHPLIAAKQLATADHIGQGRLGLNIVCGSIEDEFRMFGVSMLEHDDRYVQGEEWWSIVNQVWAGTGPFDFDGAYYHLQGVEGSPGPFRGQPPLVMNAGASPAGRAFATRFSDLHFDGVRVPEQSAGRVAESKQQARDLGRDLQVWTPVGILCRPTRQEADEYLHYLVEHGDQAAMSMVLDIHAADARGQSDPESVRRQQRQTLIERQVLARGAYCTVGDPDSVADKLIRLHAVGFDGLALNFVDYLKELPYFAQEVLPRLERKGLRAPAGSEAFAAG